MRPTRAVLAVVTSAALLASAAGCDSATTEDTNAADILIAADLELTGSAEAIGNAYKQALELKRDQLNADGSLGDRKIVLDIKDNRSDSKLSAQNISQFANNPNVVALVTGACAECVIGSLETIAARKLPTISLAPASDVVTPVAERQFIFKVGSNPLDNASALMAELEGARITKFGLISTDDAYGKNTASALGNESENSDVTMLARTIPAAEGEVDTIVAQMIGLKPQAIVVAALAERAQAVAISARKQGFTKPIYFDGAAAGNLFLTSEAKTATDGTTMIFSQTLTIDDVMATTPAKAARKAWFRDYTSRYGTYYGPASFAADAVQIIVNSVDRAGGSTNGDTLRGLVETSQLDGLSGPIRMTPTNHSGLMPQALVTLVAQSGQWQLKV